MYTLALDIYQTTALGAVVLVLGMLVVKKSAVLRKFCIPAAVAGGLLFSFLLLALHSSDVMEFQFDSTMKDVFMMAFFCSVGFMGSFRMLKTGGRMVVILLVLVSFLIITQDLIGPAVATMFGQDPKIGLAIGSISLVGGHGTAASYGELLVTEYGLTGADTIAIASATFGLAISGFIGGPLARGRIRKHGLRSSGPVVVEEHDIEEEKKDLKDSVFLAALVIMCICIGAGTYFTTAFKSVGITVPVYLGAMVLAMIVRNVADVKGIQLPLKEINTLGWISLSMFLSMALMTMKLWQIADLAATLILALVLQTIAVMFFAYFVIFSMTGKDYDSAAYVTAVCGFGMGATPNAVANMEALFEQHGPAPMALFVIPLVGSVFIDFVNTGVLTVMLNIL